MTGHHGGVAGQLSRAGITQREEEVLSAVAERLQNREIARRLHLSVRTVESHIYALRRKLGATSRDDLVKISFQTRRAGDALPSPLTKLIGRDSEMGELVGLLGAHRLVTLVGPAGVGKTRLALRVASEHAGAFPDGARLADLAPVGRELVGETLARALGIVPQPGSSLRDVMRDVAAGMRCLLLVDNCEHLVMEAAGLVAELLTAGGQIRVLATSREPLGIPGEISYQVPTLPVPPPRISLQAETARDYDAVRLFVDRAATASPEFVLTDAVAPAAAALCRRLDGLPLAIELAAARVRSFALPDLVEHLDQRFELLSAGARTALSRHRTLRGAIDWSYELLDDDERELFDRLGVFPAYFNYEAVRSVCTTDDEDDSALVRLLPQLVDKSLVMDFNPHIRRYRQLETIRAYAAERLAGSAVEATVRHRHATYYLDLAEHAAERLRGPDQRIWLDQLIIEQPNLRAAMAHDVTAGGLEVAWRWIAALERFWDTTGQRREAYEWIQRVLLIAQPPATRTAVAGLAAASMLLRPWDACFAFGLGRQAMELGAGLDDLTRARAARAAGISALWVESEFAQPALREALDRFGDEYPWERAVTMWGLASASHGAEALRWARESAELFRRVGDQMYAANALFVMAQRAIFDGIADDEVHGWLVECQALAEASGSEDDRMHATVGLGQLAWLRGEHERAAQLMEQCLPTLRRIGDQRCVGKALYILGIWAREQDRLDRAEELLCGSVEAIAQASQTLFMVKALEALADLFHVRSCPRSAAVLLGAAHTERESGNVLYQPGRPPDRQLHRKVEEALGESAFEDAYKEGERLPPARALLLASRLRPASPIPRRHPPAVPADATAQRRA